MLRYEDNPELFEILYYNLYGEGAQIKTTQLTKFELMDIKSLDISIYKHKLKSLKGIENLINLESLNISGCEKEDYIRNVYLAEKYLKKYDNKNEDKIIDALRTIYNANQIIDITPLYKLNKLKKLDLSYQRNIKSIDLQYFPNLTSLNMRGCKNLEIVNNIDCLNKICDNNITNCFYDFSSCTMLNRVNGVEKMCKLLSQRDKQNAKPILYFPTVTYCYLKVRNEQIEESFFDIKEFVRWTEFLDGAAFVKNTTKQMFLAYNKSLNIIRTISKNVKSQLQQVLQIYKWILKNIRYDKEGAKVINEQTVKEIKDSIKDQNSVTNKTRSSYVALFENKAVCVGISNLFNFMCATVGYLSEPIFCDYKKDNVKTEMIYPGHQISAIKQGNDTYYLDPTCDLGKYIPQKFMLNLDEIQNIYALDMFTYPTDSANGPSIQKLVKDLSIKFNEIEKNSNSSKNEQTLNL